MRVLAVLAVCCAAVVGAGCGSSSDPESSQEAQQARIAAKRVQERRAKKVRVEAGARRRAVKKEAARRLARREAARQRAREAADRVEARAREAREAEESEEAAECDPNYSGACLDPYASDYDCAGGSGNGPEYTGPVAVVGEDHYGLDSDGDGNGCEY